MSLDYTTHTGLGVLVKVEDLEEILDVSFDPDESGEIEEYFEKHFPEIDIQELFDDENHIAINVKGSYSSHYHKSDCGMIHSFALPDEEDLLLYMDFANRYSLPDPEFYTYVSAW